MTLKKKPTIEETERAVLIKSREEFGGLLKEQIKKGEAIIETKITDASTLELCEKQFNHWNDFNKELFKSSFNIPSNEYLNNYKNSGVYVGFKAVRNGMNPDTPAFRVKFLRPKIKAKIENLESVLGKIELLHTKSVESIETNDKTNAVSNDTVFIIHGQDDSLKKDVQLFLSRIKLNDIVLHEQPDLNRTIIEKLVQEGSKAGYVIALLSPDDKLVTGTNRARQNVILEIGYFIGKLGRERVKLLKKGDVEIPSDLQGIIYEVYDEKGSWKMKLVKDLQATNMNVDLTDLLNKF